MVGIESAGKGLDTYDHAATLTKGVKGAIHDSNATTFKTTKEARFLFTPSLRV